MNYAKELDRLAQAGPLDSLEFRTQVSVIFLCCVVAIATTGLWLLGVWFVVHYVIVLIERRTARRVAGRDSARAFVLMMALNLLVGSTFCALPVYLWMDGRPAFQFAAMALLVGSSLNIFLIRSALGYQVFCFIAPNGLAFLIIALWMASGDLGTGAAISIIVIALSILAYFAVAVIEMRRIHERHEGTREQLMQSQKIEAMGQLTGGVAHDFNNLLNVITGNLELAQSERHEGGRQRMIRQALEAAARGASLVQQMLAFVRKSRLETRSMPVPQAMAELETMARRVIPARIALEFRAVAPGLFALTDQTMLSTALLNLILNARDAIAGSGQIIVSAREVTARDLPRGLTHSGRHDAFVLFEVRDNGSGIAPAILPRITEPFFTTKPPGQGSGLGLSMVTGFAQQSDGGFVITSTLGRGAVAWLALPRGTAVEAARRAPPLPRPDLPLSGKVLIAEDQPELLQILCRLLASLGFDPHPAGSGDEACAALRAGLRPVLVITDAVMPGEMQLSDILAEARRADPGMGVLIISGYDGSQFDGLPADLEGVEFLQKPFSLGLMTQTVRGMMARPREQRAAAG